MHHPADFIHAQNVPAEAFSEHFVQKNQGDRGRKQDDRHDAESFRKGKHTADRETDAVVEMGREKIQGGGKKVPYLFQPYPQCTPHEKRFNIKKLDKYSPLCYTEEKSRLLFTERDRDRKTYGA